MNTDILRELGEWMALGFYEAGDEPWPRAYGRAWRRLYENMEVRVPAAGCLAPCEPLPNARNMESHGLWYATALIVDFDHNGGLRCNADIAAERRRQFPRHAAFIDALVRDFEQRRNHAPGGGRFGGYTHSNPDIRRVVGEGFLAMEAELDAELAAATAAPGDDPDALPLLQALKDYATGVRAFHARLGEALDAAVATAAGDRRDRLGRVAAAMRRAFLYPAGGFLEGLLAVNIAWMLDGCDSIGRIDQALGPLYERDVAAGALDPAFARDLLDELFHSFERFNGWNLQIGGYTPDGHDGCNALTRELIDACARNRFRRPNVALRLTRHTPDEVLTRALDALARGSGRPALYNDDLYVHTLRNMDLGLSLADAREIGFGGCTETMIAGLSNVGSLEGEINLAKALELALHDGFDPVAGRQEGPHTGAFEDCARFEEFEAAVRRQIQYLTDAFCARSKEQLRLRFRRGDPKLYRTFFTRDCVKRRRSFEAGGARYNWAVVSYQGIANLMDGMAAIRQAVYEERRIGRAELIAALDADFAGHDAVRQRLLAAPKFGNDDASVDVPGAALIRYAWECLYAHETPRGGRYLPSCILFTTYLGAGRTVGATPDGRRARTVLTDSVGPVQGCDRRGPTAMLNSVARLPLWLAAGTPVLNMRFQAGLLRTDQGRAATGALIRAFFARGGMQAQVAVVDRNDMLAAQRDPEAHRDLLVRIGGYSEYFVRLDRELQDSVMARTEHAT